MKRAAAAEPRPGDLARAAAAAAIMRIVLTAALAGAAASLPLPAEALDITTKLLDAN